MDFFFILGRKRGAKKVLATDYFCWSGPGWEQKKVFNFAQNNFQSKGVEKVSRLT